MGKTGIIMGISLLLVIFPGSALGQTSYFWSPMEFEGGVEFVYSWRITEGASVYYADLTIEFMERYDGYHDLVVTLTDHMSQESRTITEPKIIPLVWAMKTLEDIGSGHIVPTEENLPMVGAATLVARSMLFSGISRSGPDWYTGFTTAHPGLPDATFTVTGSRCRPDYYVAEVDELGGVDMSISGPQVMVAACIDRSLGLPVLLRIWNIQGDSSRSYSLKNYRSSKLTIPALYHEGEPDGFGGIEWGMDEAAVKGLVFQREESQGVNVYRKEQDDLRSWGVLFESIDYYFVDGKFSQVVGRVTKGANWETLKDALFKNYGQARITADAFQRVLEGLESYAWEGTERTNISIVLLDRDEEGTMTMRSLVYDMVWGF